MAHGVFFEFSYFTGSPIFFLADVGPGLGSRVGVADGPPKTEDLSEREHITRPWRAVLLNQKPLVIGGY